MRKLLGKLAVGVAALALSSGAWAADLSVWGLQAFNQQADALIGELVKEYGKTKGIDAEYVVVPANVLNERLAAAFEAGTPPDAFMTTSQMGQYYASQQLTVPVEDVLADMKKVPGGIYENMLPQGMYAGQLQALPFQVDVVPMFARRDLVEAAGAKLPTTWEELREVSKKIQAANPMMQTLGLTLSNANDAEVQLRMLMWSFGGQMFAEDGKTILFNSPETRAAYAFLGDVFKNDKTIPRSALTWDDAGNNQAYQTGRAAFIINPPSVYQWMRDNDQTLLKNTALINIPKGPGEKGRNGATASSWVWIVAKQSKQQEAAKGWLRYFLDPPRYQKIIETVGGRWAPIYPAMMSIPLFKDTPAFAQFKDMATSGIIDGYAGPPTALAAEIFATKIMTNVGQKILVDNMPVDDAVAWGQAEMEKIAAKHKS